jgi:hypothetical protein
MFSRFKKKIFLLTAAILVVIALGGLIVGIRSKGNHSAAISTTRFELQPVLPKKDWRQIAASFEGVSNSTAIFAIANLGVDGVYLRDVELEYLGIPADARLTGRSNLVRLIEVKTNLVVRGGGTAALLLKTPNEGTGWIAHLEFAPLTLKSALGEELIRRNEDWAKRIPSGIKGVPVHTIAVRF